VDWERYAACMEEIKRRTSILDKSLAPFRQSATVSVANCELAALQLRKIYELIAFATISANKNRYIRLRKSYEKDWNLAKIVKFISSGNPNFLPQPIYEVESDLEGVRFDVKVKDVPILTKEELISRHGKLGDVLHAQNPYRNPPNYRDWLEHLTNWRDEVVGLLNTHKVKIDEDHWFRVVMQGEVDGLVQVATMSAVDAHGSIEP